MKNKNMATITQTHRKKKYLNSQLRKYLHYGRIAKFLESVVQQAGYGIHANTYTDIYTLTLSLSLSNTHTHTLSHCNS